MRINHNISALKANTQLKRTNSALEQSIERLSSGFRINRAADDAAGMAISEKMKTQIRGLEQASRNASDGISVIQTAEGALSEVEAMLQRMRELSVQAANGTNTEQDREAIQAEIDQLNEEIDRISETTEFNTKKLLNGEVDRKSYSSTTKVNLVSLSDYVSSKDYEVTVNEVGTTAYVTSKGVTDTVVPAGAGGKLCINGEDILIEEGQSLAEVYTALRDLGEAVNVEVFAGEVGADGAPETVDLDKDAKLTFMATDAGSARSVEIFCDNDKLLTFLGLEDLGALETNEALTGTAIRVKGTDAKITLNTDKTTSSCFEKTATVAADGNKVTITDKNGLEMVIKIDADTPKDQVATITVLDEGPIVLQVGANERQTVTISIPKVTAETLGTEKVNVKTSEGAGDAIAALDKAINKVSAIRAKLGAYENRLDHAITNVDISNENLTEALSRIEDLDMATEMSNYTQKNVLSQAGTSMLAQANQQPQTILSLLQG